MKSPLVTIALFAFNAKDYIEAAIQSLLNQTYQHFELLIIEDCSTDGTAGLVRNFTDPRIRIFWNEHNCGIRHNRQIALRQAKGKYLFWMDNDDLSELDRIERQVAVFEKDSRVVLCGTGSLVIDAEGVPQAIKKLPITDAAIKATAFFGFPWESATVGLRISVVQESMVNLLDQVEQADDYTLYSAMMALGMFYNIPEPLYRYREHQGTHRITTNPHKAADIIAGRMVAWRIQLAALGLSATDEILLLHDKLTYYRQHIKEVDLGTGSAYLQLLQNMIDSSRNKEPEYRQVLTRNIQHKMMWLLLNKNISMFTSLSWQFKHHKIFSSHMHLSTPAKKMAVKLGLIALQ